MKAESSNPGFEHLYLKIREQEKRIYSDELVSSLPVVKKNHAHVHEWTIRKLSFQKFRNYLQKKNTPLQILDVGCGNGWMSEKLSAINHSVVTGIDVNGFEISQAKRVFQNNNRLTFYHADIFKDNLFPKDHFNIIVMAASVQYFPDLRTAIEKLFGWLHPDGEIHILDSHFYNEKNISQAKEASLQYYRAANCAMMADFYYHHLWSALDGFHFKILNRSRKEKILLKVFKTKQNYFPWIVIQKS